MLHKHKPVRIEVFTGIHLNNRTNSSLKMENIAALTPNILSSPSVLN